MLYGRNFSRMKPLRAITFLALAVALFVFLLPHGTASAETRSLTEQCSQDDAVPNAANNPGLVKDCVALLTAKDTLRGTATLDWSADRSISEWQGIGVWSSRVETIQLSGRGLTGSIPAELGKLPNLRELDISNNKLTGSIPAELGELPNVRVLDISNNKLSGSIPPQLADARFLQYLRLDNNQLTGCIPINLRNLPMPDSHIRGLSKSLNLPWCDTEVKGGPTFEVRCVSEGATYRPEANPGWAEDCATLLRAKYALQGSAYLNWDPSLRMARWDGVTLAGNGLSGSARYFGVESLDLSSSGLDGTIPAGLGNLPNLRHLNLQDNWLKGKIPGRLGKLTELRSLNLQDNRLKGKIPKKLGNLEELHTLNLQYNRLKGCIPQSLSALPLTNPSVSELSGQLGLPWCE